MFRHGKRGREAGVGERGAVLSQENENFRAKMSKHVHFDVQLFVVHAAFAARGSFIFGVLLQVLQDSFEGGVLTPEPSLPSPLPGLLDLDRGSWL